MSDSRRFQYRTARGESGGECVGEPSPHVRQLRGRDEFVAEAVAVTRDSENRAAPFRELAPAVLRRIVLCLYNGLLCGDYRCALAIDGARLARKPPE